MSYRPPRTLRRFMKSDAFVRAIVGPIGSGKSSACVMEILRRAVQQAPSPDGIRRTRFAVIRNTGPQLQDTTRKTFEQWMPLALTSRGGGWSESEFTYVMRFEHQQSGNLVECEVLFRALDRPADVRKVLSLELTGAYINEAREIAKEVVDGLQGRVGRYPSKAQGGASWFGIWMDTNPWHTGHWGYRLFSTPPAGHEVFEQPDGLGPDAENLDNLPADYYARLIPGKDAEWVDEYVRAKYPSADKGSVYGDLIAKLEAAGGIAEFEHPNDGINVTFDLGVSDSTSMWFWRLTNVGDVPRLDIIDWYECSGEGAAHYFDILNKRGYRYQKIWLPHDARQRTFQTGVSTLDLFLKHFPGLVAIGPELDIENGIGAGRWMLEQPMRIHPRCGAGIERLRAYRYAWDDDRKVFSKKPLHDLASHSADGYRYIACAVQPLVMLLRPTPPEVKKQQVVVTPTHITIDDSELFEGGRQ